MFTRRSGLRHPTDFEDLKGRRSYKSDLFVVFIYLPPRSTRSKQTQHLIIEQSSVISHLSLFSALQIWNTISIKNRLLGIKVHTVCHFEDRNQSYTPDGAQKRNEYILNK